MKFLSTILAALALAIPSTAPAVGTVNEFENDGYGVCDASTAGTVFTMPSGERYRCMWADGYWTYRRV